MAADMVLMLSAPLCEISLEYVPSSDLRICCGFQFTQAVRPGAIEAHIGFLLRWVHRYTSVHSHVQGYELHSDQWEPLKHVKDCTALDDWEHLCTAAKQRASGKRG